MAHLAGLLTFPGLQVAGSPGPFPADKDVLGSGVANSVPSELNLAKRTVLFKHAAAAFFFFNRKLLQTPPPALLLYSLTYPEVSV